MVQIISEEQINTILEICREAKKELAAVNRENYASEIELLKRKGFSGLAKLTGDGKILGIILFNLGEIKFVSIGEEFDFEKGMLETYECSESQLKKIYEAIGKPEIEAAEEKRQPYTVKEIEKMLEAYKVIGEYGTEAKKVKPPSLKQLERIFEGRIHLDKKGNIICRKVLEKIRSDLADIFGTRQAEILLKKQFKKLDINEKDITCRDVGMIMDDLRTEILEKIFGKERSNLIIQKFKKYFITYASHFI